MRVLLDSSLRYREAAEQKHGSVFYQLLTPLTRYAYAGVPYAIDNGCFARFDKPAWLKMLDEARERPARPIFVTLPDVVGSAKRTAELFERFLMDTRGLPRALVLQDGVENERIWWEELDAVFVGGSDAFKYSCFAMEAAKAAKILGKHVHVGRVNTPGRVDYWRGVADTIDGSGISRYTHMLDAVMAEINCDKPQIALGL